MKYQGDFMLDRWMRNPLPFICIAFKRLVSMGKNNYGCELLYIFYIMDEEQYEQMFVANVHVKETSVINNEMMENVPPKTINIQNVIEIMKKMDQFPLKTDLPQSYPYTALGLIIVSVGIKKKYGIGTLISPKLILTAASLCYDRETSQEYHTSQISFVPFPGERSISIVKKYYNPKYEKMVLSYPQHEVALLELQEKQGEKSGYFGLCFDKKFRQGCKTMQTYECKNKIEVKNWLKKIIPYKFPQEYFLNDVTPDLSGKPIVMREKDSLYIVGLILQNKRTVTLDNSRLYELSSWSSTPSFNLSLNNSNMTMEKLEVLTQGSWNTITHLNLSDNNLRSDEIKQLVSRQNFISLISLNLSMNCLGISGLKELIKIKWLKLQHLDLSHNDLNEAGLELLAKTKNLPRLTSLQLSWNCFEKITYLTQTHFNLIKLVLAYCNIGFSSCKQITAHRWNELQYMNLNYNMVDHSQIKLLEKEQRRNKKNFIIHIQF